MVAVIALMAVSCIAYLLGDDAFRSLMPFLSDLAGLAVILWALQRYRGTHRRVWMSIAPGVAILAIVHLYWFLRVGLGGAATADNVWTGLLQVVAWAWMINGCLVALRHRAGSAAGGVVEAALIGMGLTTPLWEFLLRPALLRSDTPIGGQIMILIPVYFIAAIMGGMFRLGPVAGAARNTLRYMFLALGCALIGMTVLITRTDPVTGGQPAWIVLFWVVAMLLLAGAAIDPANDHLGEMAPLTGSTTVRLRYVGAGLLLGPAVGAVPPLIYGIEPDPVLLCAGQAAMTVLVLVRLGQLEDNRAVQQRLLTEQAQNDELTGLPNRRHLFALLEEITDGDRPVTVLFCDLNDFKPINDELGHEAGDDVLRAVAGRLRDAVRAGDIVGRLGGDEFLIICPGAGEPEAARLRDRIVDVLGEPILWSGRRLLVGASIGVAVSAGAESADELIARADDLMYQAKRHNKGRVHTTRR